MLPLYLYFIALFLEFLVVIGLLIYILSLLFSSAMGSPYVPTKKKELLLFLKEADIKPGDIFLEIGCGDGRVVRTAVEEYKAKGIGIDINPLLIKWARFLAKWAHIKEKDLTFKTENVFKTDFKKADIIYIFLLPKIIEQLKPRLTKETKKGALIISHGFLIEKWEKYLVKKLDREPFPTYFYRLK